MMAFPTNHVANTLLQRAFKEGRTDVTNMKLQKLMFFLNGWHLAVTGQPATQDPFEVWQYGPVIPSLYRKVQEYGRAPISRYIKEFDPRSGSERAFVVHPDCKKFYEILDAVWEKYIGIDALRLSTMTHRPGTPWRRAKDEGKSVIPDDYIREYFVQEALAS